MRCAAATKKFKETGGCSWPGQASGHSDEHVNGQYKQAFTTRKQYVFVGKIIFVDFSKSRRNNNFRRSEMADGRNYNFCRL
jgi:hypothetical protein